MQHNVRSGGLGHGVLRRSGACLAFASSVLVLAASPAAAYEAWQAAAPGHGHFTVKLTPEEVPTGGNRGGSGVARLELNEARETACYAIKWKGLDGEVTAAHLHAGPRGDANGPHAIDFFNDQHFPGARSKTSGCVKSTRDKIRDIIAHPDRYYVNVHTSAFKPGAIRGQLGDGPSSG